MNFVRKKNNNKIDMSKPKKICEIVNYPKQGPFMHYLENLVSPQDLDDKPILTKREPTPYLMLPYSLENPFARIKRSRINQLKEDLSNWRREETKRFLAPNSLPAKLPIDLRQRYTAHANLRALTHEENVHELATYGRLFGPASLASQPIGGSGSGGGKRHPGLSIDLPTSAKIAQRSLLPSAKSKTGCLVATKKPAETNKLNNYDKLKFTNCSDQFTKTLSSSLVVKDVNELPANTTSIKYSDKQISQLNDSLFSHEKTNMSTFQNGVADKSLDLTVFDKAQLSKSDEKISQFMERRRRICMHELTIRTKQHEVERIDGIIAGETAYLQKEEAELMRRHDEHDRYLKSICQRTAEAIKLAENEAHKRNEINERIKRARYKLAHLNAECIKLEEEYLRLSTYRDFLFRVAKKYHENRNPEKITTAGIKVSSTSTDLFENNKQINDSENEVTPGEMPSLMSSLKSGAIDSISTMNNNIVVMEGEMGESVIKVITKEVNESDKETSQKTKDSLTQFESLSSQAKLFFGGGPQHSKSNEESEEEMNNMRFSDFFSGPQDLVDILAELESNNLTLIENVQEQEEICERVRAKAMRLNKELDHERQCVTQHIDKERKTITDLHTGVEHIKHIKDALTEYTLFDRYARVFHLGGLGQFEDLGIIPATASSSTSGARFPSSAAGNNGVTLLSEAVAAFALAAGVPAQGVPTSTSPTHHSPASHSKKKSADSSQGSGKAKKDSSSENEDVASGNASGSPAANNTAAADTGNNIGALIVTTEDGVERPTVALLLCLLHAHIQKIYFAVYGALEGGTKLDTLVMLRRLETTVDELCEMLDSYPRSLVLKAKRIVDERNRVTARRKQKEVNQIAYEYRLKKAIQNAREPPRWQHGRRLMQRSEPPSLVKRQPTALVADTSDLDEQSLFTP